MSDADELEHIVDQMEDILSRFTRNKGLHIRSGDDALFKGLVREAQGLIDDALGHGNPFSLPLVRAQFEGTRNYLGSQSYASVEESAQYVRSAARTIRRREVRVDSPIHPSQPPYVSLSRLSELRSLTSTDWDLRRLIRMCEEINSSFAAGNYLATAMILRAIADHVPPIFGATSFGQYANSIVTKSHKASMQNLQNSLRNIADGWLHVAIRKKETLPTESQVNFRQDLDVLLSEIVRTLS